MTEAAAHKDELAHLRRVRGSNKGALSRAQTKLKTFEGQPTGEIDRHLMDTMLEASRCTMQTLQDTCDALVKIDKAHADDHCEDLETSITAMETLQEALTIRSRKSKACGRLENILAYVTAFRMGDDSDAQQLTNQLDKQHGLLDEVRDNYRGLIRSDGHLQGLTEDITRRLADLTSQLPRIRVAVDSARRVEARPTVHPTAHHRRLPTIQIPKFGGNYLEWGDFWAVFNRTVHQNPDLEDDEKRAYLQQAVRDQAQTNLVDSLSTTYEDCIASLKARYHQPRKMHQHHTKLFFTCPPCKDSSKAELTRLHATLTRSRKQLIDSRHFSIDSVMESFVEGLLPPDIWRDWSKTERDQAVIPKITDLLDYIEFQATLAPDTVSPSPKPHREKANERPRQEANERPRYEKGRGRSNRAPNVKKEVYAAAKVWPDCKLCNKGSHPMYACTTYLSYDLKKRTDYVRKAKLCVNCLGESHDVSVCRNTYRCRDCGEKHNSTLHRSTDSTPEHDAAPEVMLAKTKGKGTPNTISPTLEVTVHSPKGEQTSVTALFDLGASISLVTDDVVNQLGLKRSSSGVQVIGVNGDNVNDSTASTVSLMLTSPHKKGSQLRTQAFVVPRIGGQGGWIEDGDWSALEGLQLANPNFQRPGKLDVLLGNDVLGKMELKDPIRKDKHGYLVVRNTIFGWVVNGKVSGTSPCPTTANDYVCAVTGQELTTQLLAAQRQTDKHILEFFRSEQMPEEISQTMEDIAALKHYEQTHLILASGRFQVSLPRLGKHPELGRSRPQAVKRYMNNERALLRKGRLTQFQSVMAEYLDLGHAELVPTEDLYKPDSCVFYLPMHAVYKDSTTSPLRVVFDASANTSTGVALNDTLMTGPMVYPPLTTILLRFRMHDIALTADIGKMFRGIVLDPEDRSLHRFVWRESPGEPLKDFQMSRVTFGVSCSPFLATQTLQQIADNVSDSHPLASEALHNHFYVDDYIAGAANQEQAVKIQRELQEVLAGHGLNIRKWRSNSNPVLQQIPDELQEEQPNTEAFGPQDHPKTLGVHWNARDDSFHISTSKLQQTSTVTKRTLASDVAQTFDLLGWFAPATLLMKLMIQELWRSNHDWDDPTDSEVQRKWSQWKDELPHLAAHPLPRRYFHSGLVPATSQLHGFADASLKGYAAVVYLRATYLDATPTIRLIMAKTKVNPVKGNTVPRLELCAAQLLADLITLVKEALQIPDEQLHCWSDSQIVLFWLDGKSRKNKTYVANRVNRTLELIPSHHWRHVPGTENPADCASRGISPAELLNHPLWWQGPPWLSQEPFLCPPQPALAHLNEHQDVHKETVAVVEQKKPLLILDRSNDYNKTRRTLAWIIRFMHNSRCKSKGTVRATGRRLLLKEVLQAETRLHLQAQGRMFPVNHPEKWVTDKTTKGLNPKADSSGVYRVDGRLHNSSLPYQTRHPIILRGTDPLTAQLIAHHHLSTLHGGPAQVLASLSRQYYVIHGMAVIKATCRKCVVCIRFRADRAAQLMGQLPEYRVTPGHAFQTVGTDFAGPVSISEGRARRRKAYICVFVCLKTKAIHLEAVTGLSTADFMACLRRFVARRGKPSHILSDNGTNFVGAARELDRIYEAMGSEEMQETVTRFCTSNRIEWKFNPARAPHFGGLWEATVKSVKFHLRRVEGRRIFNYQEMATILAEIEATLNSRPLMAINAHSPEGLEVLTAGHFLVGRPLAALPEGQVSDSINLVKRWDSCKQATQRFWREWSRDYLRLFHRRGKWQKPARNVQVGDLVLLRDEPNYSTNDWPLAKVVQVYPGADGFVRAVDLKIGTAIKRRPIVKLTVLLPVEMEEEETTDDLRAVLSSPGEDVLVQDRED